MPVGVAAAASAIARPRSRTNTMACSAVITPVAAAAVTSPTLCPAPAPTLASASAGRGNSDSRVTRPAPTSSGWATAVSRIVVGVRRRAVLDEVEAGHGRQPGQPVGDVRQLEPGREEAGGLGTLAGSDDDEHAPSLPASRVGSR